MKDLKKVEDFVLKNDISEIYIKPPFTEVLTALTVAMLISFWVSPIIFIMLMLVVLILSLVFISCASEGELGQSFLYENDYEKGVFSSSVLANLVKYNKKSCYAKVGHEQYIHISFGEYLAIRKYFARQRANEYKLEKDNEKSKAKRYLVKRK